MSNISRILVIAVTLVLIVRLAQLQLFQGRSFIQRSAQNRFRIENIPAVRGLIYDRNGDLLVDNQNGSRRYLKGPDFAHIIGYMATADVDDVEFFGVEMGSWVGKMGLEKEENQILSGINGGVVREYSANGMPLREFSQKNPISGRNIQLTLDGRLQHKARQLLLESGFSGTIVVSSLEGEILSLVSYPDFDPNIFSQNQQPEIVKVLQDLQKPLFNRAIGGLYPPASTFKLITSIAGLESKSITSQTEIEDTGILRVGEFSYSNWYYTGYGRTDGWVNLAKALQRSNDIYFYKVGEMTGIDNIDIWAKKMGLGTKTGISLEGESEGLVPNPVWKKETLGEDWYLGDTYITAIGQGNLLVTPIQVNFVTTEIADGGKRCPLNLVRLVSDGIPNNIVDKDISKRCYDLGISAKTLETIIQGMQLACDSGGTGWPLFQFKVINDKLPIDGLNFIDDASGSAKAVKIPVACKTGTAETGSFDQHGELNDKTHAWFTAFAPVSKPEIVVTVLLESAGQGSDIAGPLAREILKTYFENKE
ncbi:hypothetical protein COX08_02550 [Candidatus Beckwithbacteria bacterium CG23_combo_of_CG06-09_8_20_14_all_34_8]|uniref:Penicillin-binding protein 2 n=1 Tax=Candidatus Beckwithbacteria bacterium CG23_combo_of_CG06-09_8_20_14_all_34_8 TaxID=1974497 RepID=A0A2H0B662_9BACT|nr:MAG: hypothetical protein COX08_02550 [Candidatus Beckwithbacteria bacterium CG23_combo_of_CG06-09_8_20_14_all_34_8]